MHAPSFPLHVLSCSCYSRPIVSAVPLIEFALFCLGRKLKQQYFVLWDSRISSLVLQTDGKHSTLHPVGDDAGRLLRDVISSRQVLSRVARSKVTVIGRQTTRGSCSHILVSCGARGRACGRNREEAPASDELRTALLSLVAREKITLAATDSSHQSLARSFVLRSSDSVTDTKKHGHHEEPRHQTHSGQKYDQIQRTHYILNGSCSSTMSGCLPSRARRWKSRIQRPVRRSPT